MKLRLEKESVKIRLSSAEIDTLCRENSIREHIIISMHNSFIFGINVIDDVELSQIDFGKQSISINIPKHKTDRWISSNQVGIREVIETETGKLMLVVEEDLKPRRMKNTGENHATQR